MFQQQHTGSPCGYDSILDRSHHSPLITVKIWVAITAITACLQHTTALCSSCITTCMTADHVHITLTQPLSSKLHVTAKACACILLSQTVMLLLRSSSLIYAHICCEKQCCTCAESTSIPKRICKDTVINMLHDCMGTLKTDVSMLDCRL